MKVRSIYLIALLCVAAYCMLTQPRRTAVSLMRVETRLEHP